MRRRGTLFIGAGVVLSVITALLVYMLVQRPEPAPQAAATPATDGPTVAIPVAAQPLAVGATITTTDLAERQYPAALLPVGVLTDTTTIVGQVISVAVQQGEFFRAEQLGDAAARFSLQLAPGKVAITFPLEGLLQQSNTVSDGDHVDLLLTTSVTEGSAEQARAGPSTNITLQNIRVLRVIRGAGDAAGAAQGLIFEMTPQDAVIAKYVKDSGGTIDLALRSPENIEPFATRQMNQDELLDRYGFRAPVTGSSDAATQLAPAPAPVP